MIMLSVTFGWFMCGILHKSNSKERHFSDLLVREIVVMSDQVRVQSYVNVFGDSSCMNLSYIINHKSQLCPVAVQMAKLSLCVSRFLTMISK